MIARQVARPFLGLRETHRERWVPNKPEKWLLVTASRRAEPPKDHLDLILTKNE